jgi:hypothetical protein
MVLLRSGLGRLASHVMYLHFAHGQNVHITLGKGPEAPLHPRVGRDSTEPIYTQTGLKGGMR